MSKKFPEPSRQALAVEASLEEGGGVAALSPEGEASPAPESFDPYLTPPAIAEGSASGFVFREGVAQEFVGEPVLSLALAAFSAKAVQEIGDAIEDALEAVASCHAEGAAASVTLRIETAPKQGLRAVVGCVVGGIAREPRVIPADLAPATDAAEEAAPEDERQAPQGEGA